MSPHHSPPMILNTHTNAKVLTRTYKAALHEATINKNRVGEMEEAWLDIPETVGTGKYDNEQRGWLDNPQWNGAMQRYTPLDGPGAKGVRP